AERSGESRLRRIAERVLEIVADLASGKSRAGIDRKRIVARREPVGIVAIVLGILTLELNREIGRAAVVARIEAVRLAASPRADLVDLDTDTAQAVDDRFARGARALAREHVHAIQIERGERSIGLQLA